MCLLLEPPLFGEARARWTGARKEAISKKAFFAIPFYKLNPTQKEVERTLTPTAVLARSQFLLCPPAPFFVSGHEIFGYLKNLGAQKKTHLVWRLRWALIGDFYLLSPRFAKGKIGHQRIGTLFCSGEMLRNRHVSVTVYPKDQVRWVLPPFLV